MECFRIDESGYTGFDLLNTDQRFQGASAIAGEDRSSEHEPRNCQADQGASNRVGRPVRPEINARDGFVARVKDFGCRIAIDDFGAGYTSFRNLRKLGVDIVKIDGAFVRDIMRSEDDRAFVRMLIELAQRLKLETVAEWVPDEDAARMLRDWGCDYLQGDLIGRATLGRPWDSGPANAAAS